MAIDKRVMTAALFAEQVVAALGNCKPVNPAYGSPAGETIRALREAKIEYLSSGHYGVVLKIPGTDHVLKVCTAETDGYPMYAQWAQLNPGPHIPEIYWTCRISPSLFVCAMPGYLERHAAPDFDNQMRDYNSPLKLRLELVKRTLGSLARDDTHNGNFMYCPLRREIIITDPFANLYSDQDKAECTATGRSYKPQLKVQQELFAEGPVDTGRACDSADDKLVAAMSKLARLDAHRQAARRGVLEQNMFAQGAAVPKDWVRGRGARGVFHFDDPAMQNIRKHQTTILRMAKPRPAVSKFLMRSFMNPFAVPPAFKIPKDWPLEFNLRKDDRDVINIRV